MWRPIVVPFKNMYLLTKWEGRMGKYFTWGHGVETVRYDRESNIIPICPT